MAGAEALPTRPLFVVLDGVDGCGKTTQATRLAARLGALRGAGHPAPLHLREPGSTAAGERLRALVLDPDVPLGDGTLALLFVAARREMLQRLVAPALAEGRDVVVERFHPSTFAYQGEAARRRAGGEPAGSDGLDRDGATYDDEALLALLRGWAGAPAPTVEIVLDLPGDVAFERALARDGGGVDRFESRGPGFQRDVAAAMRDYVRRVPTADAVDATGSEDEVAERILACVVAHAREAARV
ncbi:MAG: thymidylate kinase [Planctomycetota bacterium]